RACYPNRIPYAGKVFQSALSANAVAGQQLKRHRRPLPDDLWLIRNALLVSAPAGIDAIGSPVEDRFDAADLAVLDLEELSELPGPVDVLMVEEGKGEDNAVLAIDRHEPPVAHARDDVFQRHLELLQLITSVVPVTGLRMGTLVERLPFSYLSQSSVKG